jgi:hypothetical protein
MLEGGELGNCPLQHVRIVSITDDLALLRDLLLELFCVDETKVGFQFGQKRRRVVRSGSSAAVEVRYHVAELLHILGDVRP